MNTKMMKAYLLRGVAHGGVVICETDISKSDYVGGYVLIGEADVEFQMLSEREQTEGVISALQAKKQKLMADSQRQIENIEQEIQSLLAITHEPAEAL